MCVELLLRSHFLCLCHLVVLHCKWKHHPWIFFFFILLEWMSACVVEGERWRDCKVQSEPVSWWGLTWELFLCEPGRDHYCNEGSMAATLAGPRAALSSWSSAMWITLIKALLHSTTIFFKKSEITVTYLRRHAPSLPQWVIVSNCPAVSGHSWKHADANTKPWVTHPGMKWFKYPVWK